MKSTPSDFGPDWEKRLQRDRADAVPAVDLPALLRVVRQAEWPVAESGWTAEFYRLFAGRTALATCLAGAGGFALLASWPVWECWQELAWVQMIAPTLGGGS